MTILLRNNQQHLRIDDLRYRAFAYLNSTYCRIAPNSNEPFRYTWDARRALSDEALSSIRSYITEIVSALTPTINRLGHIPLYQHMEAHLCLLADYINPVTNQNLVAQARLLATADCPQYGPYLTQFRQAIYTNAALLERPLSQ
ncbi:MAG: hypothetical protein HY069_04100 [Chlamydiia bacterium]|nr:hypothetical protein [Chlamydiia bacterium]